jgi:hypothetical protein
MVVRVVVLVYHQVQYNLAAVVLVQRVKVFLAVLLVQTILPTVEQVVVVELVDRVSMLQTLWVAMEAMVFYPVSTLLLAYG